MNTAEEYAAAVGLGLVLLLLRRNLSLAAFAAVALDEALEAAVVLGVAMLLKMRKALKLGGR